MTIKRVLIDNIFDRSGLAKFATQLVELEVEIVSRNIDITKYLKRNKIPVSALSEAAYYDQLHSTDDNYHIDLFVVNLPNIENIINKPGQSLNVVRESVDINTISDMRLVATRFDKILPVISVNDYDQVIDDIKTGKIMTEHQRMIYAQKVFAFTSRYDSIISQYLYLTAF